jgi:uncharacterized BrkB/YihY/UPF0761 family membrane protein
MEIRRRSDFADAIVETLDGFRRHLTSRNAAVLTYYGFLTIFPLFLAATTILGFVLENDPSLRDEIVDSALSQIPIVGQQIADNSSGGLNGSWWALIIGLGAALWGSLKAFVGVQSAYDDTWEIGIDDRANGAAKRGRALVGLAVIGGAQVGTVALAAVVDRAGLPRIGQILIVLGGLAINIVVVGAMYRFLTSANVTWQILWPGAVCCGCVYTVLQFVGTAIATRALDSASAYGAFAATLALLSWLSLHALTNLMGAELNAALERRRARDRAWDANHNMAPVTPAR